MTGNTLIKIIHLFASMNHKCRIVLSFKVNQKNGCFGKQPFEYLSYIAFDFFCQYFCKGKNNL
ncbi:hypothetical protein D1164_05385 [Mariniphaga sediminis]|uniref:Uncharacterized protein n=1 Tax=Mariniphaga sediminis TaxID=1628158 RepID=A0A399D4K3_9BACT|nr:hypothetical protein D1164_05385 [Mariniphaga sediminis]